MPSLADAKRLVRQWDCATFPTRASCIHYHWKKHGSHLLLWDYLYAADGFHYSSAKTGILSGGRLKFSRRNGEFLITRNGKIVCYGYNL